MKRTFILEAFILSSLFSLFTLNLSAVERSKFSSSDEEVKGFQLGLSTSMNFSWVKPIEPPLRSNGTGVGFGFGVTGDYNFSKTKKNYFLSMELMYHSIVNKTRLGAEIYTQNNAQKYRYQELEHTFKINYIEFPLSLKLKVNEIGYTTFFAQFGFAPSLLYRTKAKWKGQRVDGSGDIFITDYYLNNAKNTTDQEFDAYRDDIRFFRLAMIAGAGMEYRFSGTTALIISLRFNNGLNNIFADNREPKANGINNFLSLNAGLLF